MDQELLQQWRADRSWLYGKIRLYVVYDAYQYRKFTTASVTYLLKNNYHVFISYFSKKFVIAVTDTKHPTLQPVFKIDIATDTVRGLLSRDTLLKMATDAIDWAIVQDETPDYMIKGETNDN